jgi:UDP-N-acetyl-D-mannosaminuronic acid transferase (WecB/TagA/CpsF family)
LYKKYGDRICGSDLTKHVLAKAIKNHTKITIIDLYNPTDIKKVESQKIFSEKLKEKFPKINFDYFIYDEKEKNKILEQIKKSDSKILFSTLGMKQQEKSVVEIMKSCSNIKL